MRRKPQKLKIRVVNKLSPELAAAVLVPLLVKRLLKQATLQADAGDSVPPDDEVSDES